MMNYVIGAALGLIVLLPFLKAPTKVIAAYGYIALVCMLSIYVGAHLVSSEMPRLLIEVAIASTASVAGLVFKAKWPLGIGVLVLCHGLYDFAFGHASGVAAWYPPVCMGFDVVVGSGLIWLMIKTGSQTKSIGSLS